MPEGTFVPPPSGANLKQLLDEWVRVLGGRYSTHTVKAYGYGVEDLFRYLLPLQITQARALTRRHIEGWQDQMNLRKLKPHTRAGHTIAVRKFLRWAEQRGIGFGHPNLWLDVPSISVPERVPRPLPGEDLQKILTHLEALPPTLVNLRDRALFHAFITSGAKIGDMIKLKRKDLSRIANPRQKGERTIVITQSVVEEIKQYLDARTDDCPAMWVTVERDPARPLADDGVHKILERLADRIGIRRFSSHNLRDTTTLKLMEADIPYADIAEHRGNKRIEPLRKFAAIVAQRRQRALDAMDNVIAPRANVQTKEKPKLGMVQMILDPGSKPKKMTIHINHTMDLPEQGVIWQIPDSNGEYTSYRVLSVRKAQREADLERIDKKGE